MNSLIDKLSKYDGLSSLTELINAKKIISIKDVEFIEEEIKRENPLDLDSVLYGIMLDILKYNNEFLGLNISTEEDEGIAIKEKEILWSDILNYLSIDYNLIDVNLKKEMENVENLKNILETARFIKNSRRAENRIINKINDVNIIICILLYSNKKYISNIINYFKDGDTVDGRALGKAIEAIPSIFLVNSKGDVPSNYELFIKNYEILKNEGVNVRNIIINKPILMISSNLENLVNSIKDVIA